MKSFKLALAALAATSTLSSAHAGGKMHHLEIPGGLPAMLTFMGLQNSVSASQNINHPELVNFNWVQTDGTETKEATYEEYDACEATKPNQPITDMHCYIELDENDPTYALFANAPSLDKR